MTALMFEQRAIVALCRHTAVTEALALTSRADLSSEPRDQTFYKFVRRNQSWETCWFSGMTGGSALSMSTLLNSASSATRSRSSLCFLRVSSSTEPPHVATRKPASASGRKIWVDPARLQSHCNHRNTAEGQVDPDEQSNCPSRSSGKSRQDDSGEDRGQRFRSPASSPMLPPIPSDDQGRTSQTPRPQ